MSDKPPHFSREPAHSVSYWLDLFTGTTWQEFTDAGARVSGFTYRRRRTVARIRQRDVLLCYVTGVKRWVGALEVLGRSSNKSRIWKDAEFPERLSVKPLVTLPPTHGVPMDELLGKVDFHAIDSPKGKYKGFLRTSPTLFRRQSDGELVLRLLKEAEANPVVRPVDLRRLARKPLSFTVKREASDKRRKAQRTSRRRQAPR